MTVADFAQIALGEVMGDHQRWTRCAEHHTGVEGSIYIDWQVPDVFAWKAGALARLSTFGADNAVPCFSCFVARTQRTCPKYPVGWLLSRNGKGHCG